MTKRHFIAIAKILAAGKGPERDRIANALADVFASDNPRFDRARFLKAAGVI